MKVLNLGIPCSVELLIPALCSLQISCLFIFTSSLVIALRLQGFNGTTIAHLKVWVVVACAYIQVAILASVRGFLKETNIARVGDTSSFGIFSCHMSYLSFEVTDMVISGQNLS